MSATRNPLARLRRLLRAFVRAHKSAPVHVPRWQSRANW